MKKQTLKTILYLLAIIIIIMIAVFHLLQIKEIDQSFLDNYKEFENYRLVNKSPLVYSVSKEGNDAGYLVFEEGYGYQSTIVTATLISKDGIIKDIKVYQENETPAFMYKINNSSFFSSNFANKSIKDGFSIYTNVDAVSGATISSNAITNTVHKGVTYVGKNYLNLDIPTIQHGSMIGRTEIALVIMFLLALFASKTRQKKLKLLVRIYSLLILGFWLTQFITLSAFASILSLNFPSIVNNFKWYILVFGALLLIIVTGKNLYCAYICPFGSLQKLVYNSAKLSYFRLHPKVFKILSVLPGVIAYLALVLALSTSNIAATNYEPFSLIFGRTGTGVQWLILPIVLIGALFIKNFYCNFGCPVGFMLNQVFKLRKKVVNVFCQRNKRKIN